MIKGRYIGLVTINFCVDKNTPGLLPFEELKKSVEKDLNGVVKNILDNEVSDIATVTVEQQDANLYLADD